MRASRHIHIYRASCGIVVLRHGFVRAQRCNCTGGYRDLTQGCTAAAQIDRNVATGRGIANTSRAATANFALLGLNTAAGNCGDTADIQRSTRQIERDITAGRGTVLLFTFAALARGGHCKITAHIKRCIRADINRDIACNCVLSDASSAIVSDSEEVIETLRRGTHGQIAAHKQSASWRAQSAGLIKVDGDVPAITLAIASAQAERAGHKDCSVAGDIHIDCIAGRQVEINRRDEWAARVRYSHVEGRNPIVRITHPCLKSDGILCENLGRA